MNWLPFLILFPLMAEAPTEVDGGALAVETTDDGSGAPVEFGADVTFASAYVFRGALLHGSRTVPSFQPSVWWDFGNRMPGSLQFNVWSALAMGNRDQVRREASASEIDFGLSYEIGLARDWLQLGAGFVYYIYPGEEEVDGEKEFALSLGLGNVSFSPSVSVYFTVHPYVAVHFEPSVGWEQSFGPVTLGLDLILGATVNEDDATVDHTTLSAHFSHSTDPISVGFSLAYTIQIAPEDLGFIDRSILWGTVSLTYN